MCDLDLIKDPYQQHFFKYWISSDPSPTSVPHYIVLLSVLHGREHIDTVTMKGISIFAVIIWSIYNNQEKDESSE